MFTIENLTYSLSVDGASFGVILDGCEVARLDVRSAVHGMNDAYGTVRDEEPETPVLTETREEGSSHVFVWRGKSSLWDEKIYTLCAGPLRFTYRVAVKGRGRVDGVEYFSGNAAEAGHGSAYEFQVGFNPCESWYNKEDYYFKASTPCHRWSVLMVPPMFCYSFRCPALSRQLALGLVARPGSTISTASTIFPGRADGRAGSRS